MDFIRNRVKLILTQGVSGEYVNSILRHENEDTGNTFIQDVIADIIASSSWKDEKILSDDDIRLAIGRVLVERLGE